MRLLTEHLNRLVAEAFQNKCKSYLKKKMIVLHCKLIIDNRPWDGQEAAVSWLSVLYDQ